MLFNTAVLPLVVSLAGLIVAAPHRMDASMMARRQGIPDSCVIPTGVGPSTSGFDDATAPTIIPNCTAGTGVNSTDTGLNSTDPGLNSTGTVTVTVTVAQMTAPTDIAANSTATVDPTTTADSDPTIPIANPTPTPGTDCDDFLPLDSAQFIQCLGGDAAQTANRRRELNRL
ncbi:hypothetical protein K438DRAFT_1748066 [Mycena galopus ATCC 62051]|nr:hypothetical protein K438DRAFT_1748066 [Mycena galopus ATCC 62051]